MEEARMSRSEKMVPRDAVVYALRCLGFQPDEANGGSGGHPTWRNEEGKRIRPADLSKAVPMGTLHAIGQSLENQGVCLGREFRARVREWVQPKPPAAGEYRTSTSNPLPPKPKPYVELKAAYPKNAVVLVDPDIANRLKAMKVRVGLGTSGYPRLIDRDRTELGGLPRLIAGAVGNERVQFIDTKRRYDCRRSNLKYRGEALAPPSTTAPQTASAPAERPPAPEPAPEPAPTPKRSASTSRFEIRAEFSVYVGGTLVGIFPTESEAKERLAELLLES
jgi:hypothetical protein